MNTASSDASPVPAPASTPPRRRRDYRVLAVFFVVVAVAALGFLADRLPGRGTDTAQEQGMPAHGGSIRPDASPFAGIPETPEQVAREEAEAAVPPPQSPEEAEKRALRKYARSELAAKRFMKAIPPLVRLIELAPADAHAHLLMGLALEGANNFDLARKYYEAAIDRDVMLPDAYFGFATTSEALGDLESALGAMRSFLHVQRDDDPYRLRVAQARSAIWEWESKLGRGPWGPTKGIPPGFTEEELRRDGRGVGTKMQIPGSRRPDGTQDFEIKHSDKIPMYKR